MRKILGLLILVTVLVGCENQQGIQEDIARLKRTRSQLDNDIKNTESKLLSIRENINELNDELGVLNIYKAGKEPRYILKLRLKQSHVSLDIGKHLKDAMNAVEFDLPVDKEFYNSVKVGSNIVDDFRSGSFMVEGSFGSWKMTVLEKRIED